MALLSNAGSFPPIKFSYFENEFGSNPTRSIGAYRVSETIGGLTVPTIGWTATKSMPIPNSGTIKFSDFYRKMAITVVDLHSGDATTRKSIRNEYNADNVRVVGGFRSRPSDTGEDSGDGCVRGKYVIARVNKTIGSVKEDDDKSKVALRTGAWDANTELEINIGSDGKLFGAGGDGGNGGHGHDPKGSGGAGVKNNAPNNATSALGIEYFSGNATKIINGGRIQCGYGGGGGGGHAAKDPDKGKCSTCDPSQGGSGGGGGAGYPNGSGGTGSTAGTGGNDGNNSTNTVHGDGGTATTNNEGARPGRATGGAGGDGADQNQSASQGENSSGSYGGQDEANGGAIGYNGDAIRVVSGSGSYSLSGNAAIGSVVTGSTVS